jgi:hypothetical protein
VREVYGLLWRYDYVKLLIKQTTSASKYGETNVASNPEKKNSHPYFGRVRAGMFPANPNAFQ